MRAVFLQARLDSVRLPAKALFRLKDKTVIEHVMLALLKIKADHHVLLTDAESASILKEYARSCSFQIFIGPKDDVLKRYADAVTHFNVSMLVRATGDNPLVSSALGNAIVKDHLLQEADYSGFLGMPLGMGVEVVKAAALLEADRLALDPYEREHVTPYLYRRADTFKIHRPKVNPRFFLPYVRVTLDTPEDYHFIRSIYDDIYQGETIDTVELIQWLKKNQKAQTQRKIPDLPILKNA